MSEINNIKTPFTSVVVGRKGANSLNNVSQLQQSPQQSNNNDSTVSDKVSLTNTATQLQSLRQTISDSPVVNQDRVSALKAAIDDGSYQVDVEALAKNIQSFESQLN